MIIRMLRWTFVIALAGCGQVTGEKLDAALVVPKDAAPDAFSCPTGETACATACCSGATQVCQANVCQPANSTCNRVRLGDPAAPDGFYTNPNDNTTIYCDFTNSKTYEGFLVNVYTTTPPGYTLARATDFQDAGFQKAFIAFYNRDGGIKSFSTFNAGNCCYTTVTPNRFFLNGTVMFIGQGASSRCGMQITAGQAYTMGEGNTFLAAPFAANFFTTRPVTEASGCSDDSNPAFYFKRRDGLD
jgi:hypothetical protein